MKYSIHALQDSHKFAGAQYICYAATPFYVVNFLYFVQNLIQMKDKEQ
jgi:hypothetical protein